MHTLAAFAAEAALVESMVRGIRVDAWDRPAMGAWDTKALVAHLVRAADRTSVYLPQPVEGDAPEHDRVTYFQMDLAAAADQIADRSITDATRIGAAALPQAFADAWRQTVADCEPLPDDHLMTTFRGPMLMAEYVCTRVLELVVHHEDLGRALQVPVTHDADALDITIGILEGMLGEPAGSTGLDGVPFVMAATGRDRAEDPRLPVLA